MIDFNEIFKIGSVIGTIIGVMIFVIGTLIFFFNNLQNPVILITGLVIGFCTICGSLFE